MINIWYFASGVSQSLTLLPLQTFSYPSLDNCLLPARVFSIHFHGKCFSQSLHKIPVGEELDFHSQLATVWYMGGCGSRLWE